MRSLLSIIRYTFIQQFRNRLYLVVIFFGALLLAVSLLFGALSADQEMRVIVDFGLATTEFFGLVAAVFGAVTLILEEMESRTIYLILTRPLPRSHYILGRFFGLLCAVWASMGIMVVLHLTLLGLKGWTMDVRYLACFPPMAFKIMVVTSLALFFSLFSSSAVSSVVFTFFFWVLGHFIPELGFLAQRSQNTISAYAVKTVVMIIPNFQMMNYRDFWDVPGFVWSDAWSGAVYSVLYAAACLCLSAALFTRKEF